MALTINRPDLSDALPTVSESGIDLLSDITATTIWADDALQYMLRGNDALTLDTEFASVYAQYFGNSPLDTTMAFAAVTRQSFAMIDTVSTLDFSESSLLAETDLVVTTASRPKSTTEGFFQFPGIIDNGQGGSWSIGSFNSGLDYMLAAPEAGGGQYSSWTILHEIGHSLGLQHTHQERNGLPALVSVGKYMNNERYSVMSYNSASPGAKYGHAVSLMALDVAALQGLYGAEDYASGSSSYTLMDARGGSLSLTEGGVEIGRALYCIWDSGGIDSIDYDGSGASVMINLNDATLDTSGNSAELQALFAQIQATGFYDQMSKALRKTIFNEWQNAGGFFSQVLDVKDKQYVASNGGYSIAHGAEIENAVGGRGADILIGNEQANVMYGGDGNDSLLGGAGTDRVWGDAGNDWVDGGADSDQLVGGTGKDRFIFSTSYSTDTIIDFQKGDKIDLRGLEGIDDVRDLFDNHMTESNGSVLITVGSDVLTVKGMTVIDMSSGDFAL